MRSRSIIVDVACNHPENGHFAGRAWGLTIYTQRGHVDFGHDAPDEGAPFKVEEVGRNVGSPQGLGIFTIGHARFPFVAWGEWAGNWCVNRYVMKRPAGLRFLHYINRHNDWTMEAGDTRIFDWLMSLYSRPDYLPHVAIQPVPSLTVGPCQSRQDDN